MILVIGGACQGKTEYVRTHFGKELPVINGYHERIRQQLINGQNPMEEAKELLLKNGDCIIISDEIGCGLVPVDAFEREYREVTGRVCCYLAKKAEQVIRVTCGIGSRIA